MDNQPDFSSAARKALFQSDRRPEKETESESVYENIPGAGRSAAEGAERHVRYKVTMNLDGDVVAYFKNEASRIGRPYQALINLVLREYIEGTRPEKTAKDVAAILLSDESFLDALSEQLKTRKG